MSALPSVCHSLMASFPFRGFPDRNAPTKLVIFFRISNDFLTLTMRDNASPWEPKALQQGLKQLLLRVQQQGLSVPRARLARRACLCSPRRPLYSLLSFQYSRLRSAMPLAPHQIPATPSASPQIPAMPSATIQILRAQAQRAASSGTRFSHKTPKTCIYATLSRKYTCFYAILQLFLHSNRENYGKKTSCGIEYGRCRSGRMLVCTVCTQVWADCSRHFRNRQ